METTNSTNYTNYIYDRDSHDYDDFFTDEDYDRRRAERDGWETSTWDGKW